MSDLSRVYVLAGGLTVEREVSLRSGRRVCDALRGIDIDARVFDADSALLPLLAADPPDAVFIALHGGSGEDGALRGVLDLVGVPYAGSSARACRLAFDKPTAKAVVAAAGIDTPPWLAIPHATFRELGAAAVLDRLVDRLGLPLMVKPAAGGSALGSAIARTPDELPGALVGCFAYDETALVERFIEGVEVAVGVVDIDGSPTALPAVEIEVPDGRYDYAARYTTGTTRFHVPARVAALTTARLAEVAVLAHRSLGLAGISRTDAIVDSAGRAQFLEVNVSPGMTETSLVPMALAAEGRDLGEMCRELLRQAVDRRATSADR